MHPEAKPELRVRFKAIVLGYVKLISIDVISVSTTTKKLFERTDSKSA